MKLLKIIILTVLAFCSVTLSAQNPDGTPEKITGKEAKNAAKEITDNYSDWTSVTMSGKLDLDNLAISPTVKIYMLKGEKIVISIRVPLLGELGTLDISGGQYTLVNKVKKVYCREPLSSLMADLPLNLTDVQNILLGRIFLPGYGALSMENYEKADFYVSDEIDGWFVLPKEQPLQYDVTCGYNTIADGRTDNIFVGTLDGENQATAYYEYDRDKMNIDLVVRTRGKDREFTFRINEIDYMGRPVKPANIDGSYRKVTLKEFSRSMK